MTLKSLIHRQWKNVESICCSSVFNLWIIFSKPAQFFWTSLIFVNQFLINCLKKGLFFLGCGWKIGAWLFKGGSEKELDARWKRRGRKDGTFPAIYHLHISSYSFILAYHPTGSFIYPPDLFTTPPLHYLFIHFDIVLTRIWTTNLQICCHPFSPLDHGRIRWRAMNICWYYK